MKRRIKRYVALCILVALMLEIVPCQNHVQEVKAEILPFTIEDTMEGVVDTEVIAKKLELTDDNAEIIDAGLPDLVFVMTSLSNNVKKIDVVGMMGVIHTFKVKQSDMDWSNYADSYDWDDEIAKWFDPLGTVKGIYHDYNYQEEKDSIYIVINPETKKYDLLNATTGKYFEYGALSAAKGYEYIRGKKHSRETGGDYYDVIGISCFPNATSGWNDGWSDGSRERIILDIHGEVLLEKSIAKIIRFNSKNRMVVCSVNSNEEGEPVSSIFDRTMYLIDKEKGIMARTDEIGGNGYEFFGKRNLLIDDFRENYCYIDIDSGEIKTLGFVHEEEDQHTGVMGASDEGIYVVDEDYGISGTTDAFCNIYFISPDGNKEKLKYDNIEKTVGEDSVVCSVKNCSDQKKLYVVQGGEEVYQCISNINEIINGTSHSRRWDIDIKWWQGDYGYVSTDCGEAGELITKDGEVILTFDEDIAEHGINLYNNRLFTYTSKGQSYVYDIKTEKTWEGVFGDIATSYSGSKYCEAAYTIQCKNALLGRLNDSIINFDNGKIYYVGDKRERIYNIYENKDDMLIHFGDGDDSLINQDMEVVDKNVWYLTSSGNYYKKDGIYDKDGKRIQECYPIEELYDRMCCYLPVSGFVFNSSELVAASTDEETEYGWDNGFTYYDADGQRLTEREYYQTSAFHADLAYVYDGERTEVIDNYGNTVISLKVEKTPFSDWNNKAFAACGSKLAMRYHTLLVKDTEKRYYFYNFSKFISSEGKDEDGKYIRDKQRTTDRLLAHAESIPDFKFQGMDVTFTVPEEVPVLGGGEMSLDFGKVPIVFEKSENQFRFGLGIENKKSGDDEELLLFHDSDTWGSFKKAVEKQKSNLLKGTNILLASKSGIASTPFDKSVETKIYGYIEGTLDGGKIVSEEGKMVMEISFSAEKKWQTVIVVVPVVFTAKAKAGGKFTMELGLDYAESSVFCKGEFEFTLPKIRLSAGVGVAYVADISAYGSFTNTLKISDGWGEEPSITDTVSGELGASASLFCATYEKALWEGEKEIYPGSKKKLGTNRSLTEGMKESDFVIDRDYAEKTSEWINQEEDFGQANKIQVLQKSVYTQANPKIVTLNDGTKLMIFVTDLKERGIGNHTAIAYSVYDDSEGAWSEPEIVDDDGSADFYPEIATDGSHTFITWADAGETDFTKDTTVSEMAEACDISVARFDSASKKFVDVTSLTDNNYADLRPSIVVKDDMACVTWLANENSDCLKLSGKNEICYALNKNGEWGGAQSYLVTQKPVKDVRVGELDTEVTIAYTIDEDADFTTTEDVSLCMGNLADEDAIAINDRKNISSLQFVKLGGKNILAFSDDTGLCYMEDSEKCHKLLDEEAQTGANYQFVSGNNSDMIICSEPTEQGSNIKGYIVTDGVVGLPIPLTDQKKYIKNPNGFYDKGKYYLAFMREQVVIAGNSLDVSADICAMQFGEYTDLAVTAVDVDEETVVLGKEGTVSVNISNLGTESISECNLQIKNGEEVVGTTTVKELKPGVETAEVVSIQLSEDCTEGTKLTCEAVADGEQYLKNNSLEFKVGKTNLKLDVFTPETVTYVNAYVTNTSGFDTTGGLNVYDTDEKGEMLRKIELGKIKAGERKRIKLTSTDLENIVETEKSLCFKVVADKKESYYSDNYGFVFVGGQNSSEDTDDEEENEREDMPKEDKPDEVVNQPANSAVINNTPPVGKNNASNSNQSKTKTRTKKKAPGKVKITSVKNKKGRKVIVKFKRLSGTKGFQIQYSLKKSFRKKKVKTTKNTFYIIKKLKKSKNYFIRVRAYRLSGAKRIYGKWSAVKRVRIKK